MSRKPPLDDISKTKAKNTVFKRFTIIENLIVYDYPLLVLAESPDKKKWLFKWCDIIDQNSNIERWLAFKISDERLSSLKGNKISLREAITLVEEKLFIFDAYDLLDPIDIRVLFPENIPIDYLPSEDISVDGTFMKPKNQENRFTINLHVFSKDIAEGVAPFSILSPLLEKFQNYIRWAAHSIDKSIVAFSLRDWTTINLVSVSAGSFRMQCVSNLDKDKSEKLSKACEFLAKLSSSDFINIENIKEKIGDEALIYARSLAEFAAKLDISLSINWVSEKIPNAHLSIDKRRAENLLKIMKKDEPMGIIVIKLTKNEVEPLLKPVKGIGGMQSLLRGLQNKLSKENTIELTTDEIEKIRRYGLNYGHGGFQVRLVGIASALERVYTSFQII